MTVRVLIVDDEAVARRRIRRLLAAEPDVTVISECADGASALGVITSDRPDIAFLDVQIGELDGFERHVCTKELLLRDTLASIEKQLEPEQFARIHRSVIVQLDRIAGLHLSQSRRRRRGLAWRHPAGAQPHMARTRSAAVAAAICRAVMVFSQFRN